MRVRGECELEGKKFVLETNKWFVLVSLSAYKSASIKFNGNLGRNAVQLLYRLKEYDADTQVQACLQLVRSSKDIRACLDAFDYALALTEEKSPTMHAEVHLELSLFMLLRYRELSIAVRGTDHSSSLWDDISDHILVSFAVHPVVFADDVLFLLPESFSFSFIPQGRFFRVFISL